VPTESATLADLEQLVRLVRQIRDWKSLGFKTRRRGDHAQRGHQTELFPHPIDPFRSVHAFRLRPVKTQPTGRAAAYWPMMAWTVRSGKRQRLR